MNAPTSTDHVTLRPGAYADSVALLQVSRDVQAAPGAVRRVITSLRASAAPNDTACELNMLSAACSAATTPTWNASPSSRWTL